MTPEQRKGAIRQLRKEAAIERELIAQGICPGCKKPGVTVRRDSRQAGPFMGKDSGQGDWHNVRHPTQDGGCGYICDIVMPCA